MTKISLSHRGTKIEDLRKAKRGNIIYMEENEVGGRRYWSDEIGGGVVIWDTSLVSKEALQLAIICEDKLNETGS